MSRFEIDPEALRRFAEQAAANVATHLNEVVAEVAASHAGQPVDVIKDEIRRKAKRPDFELGEDDTLQLVAEAISKGEQPPLYRA